LVVLYTPLATSAVYYLHCVMYRTLYVRLQRCASLFGPQTFFPYPPTPTHAQCRPLITLFPRHNHCFRSGASRRLNCARYAVREENPGDAVAVAVSDFASGINHSRLYPPRRLTPHTYTPLVVPVHQSIYTHTIHTHNHSHLHQPLAEALPSKSTVYFIIIIFTHVVKKIYVPITCSYTYFHHIFTSTIHFCKVCG